MLLQRLRPSSGKRSLLYTGDKFVFMALARKIGRFLLLYFSFRAHANVYLYIYTRAHMFSGLRSNWNLLLLQCSVCIRARCGSEARASFWRGNVNNLSPYNSSLALLHFERKRKPGARFRLPVRNPPRDRGDGTAMTSRGERHYMVREFRTRSVYIV